MYLSYIDGIRALAVVSVFIYHLNPQLMPGGFSGVDVFFVVSGYVVSLSLDKHRGLKLTSFLSLFYSRRVKRILPALIFCLLGTTILACLFVPEGHMTSRHAETALYAFFGLSNIVLATGSDSYFGPIAEFNPFTHTWSLGVEEQFYFVFPFVFILWSSGKKPFHKKLAVFIFVALFFLSLVCAWWFSETNKLYEYYLILSRFWQLAAGILLYQFVKSSYESKLRPFSRFMVPLSWVSLLLVIAGFVISDETRFPIPWAFLGVSGTFFLLLSMHYLERGAVRSFLEHKIMSVIGKLSYSLYLWHWPVIVLFKWTVGIDSVFKCVLAVLIATGLSWISYSFIESPVRQLVWINALPRYAVVLGGLFVIVISSYSGSLMFSKRNSFTLSSTKNVDDWLTHKYNPYADMVLPGQFKASQEVFHEGVKFKYSIGKTEKDHTLFVVGDSHAGAYTPMLQKMSVTTGNDVVLYTKPGCGDTINWPFENQTDDCQRFLEASFSDVLRQLEKGDVVFLASLKLRRFAEQWELFDPEEQKKIMFNEASQSNRVLTVDQNIEAIKPYVEKGASVVFEAPKPIFKSPPFRCAEWFNQWNPICGEGLSVNRDEMLEYRRPVMDSLSKISSSLSNVYVYDPFPVLCPSDECRAVEGERPLFYDGDHLSTYGNMVVFEDFSAFISSNSLMSFRAEQENKFFSKNIYLSNNWHNIEPSGVWSSGEMADVIIRKNNYGGVRFFVNGAIHRYFDEMGIQELYVKVYLDGKPYSTVMFDINKQTLPVDIYADFSSKDRVITFRAAELVAPDSLGLNNDKRKLGIFLHKNIEFITAQPAIAQKQSTEI